MNRAVLDVVEATQLASDAAVIAGVIEWLGLRNVVSELVHDPVFRHELDLLRRTEQRCRTGGTDIRAHLDYDITHRVLKEWLKESDRLAEEVAGRSDLRRQRRRGILRILSGMNRGMPLDFPPLAAISTMPWRHAEWRTLRLRDELEWMAILFIPISHPAVKIRPVVDVLSHRQVRAILDWRASTLDHYISVIPRGLGGLRRIETAPAVRQGDDDAAQNTARVIAHSRRRMHQSAFDTWSFVIWLAANQN